MRRFREKHCLPLIPRYPRASLDSSRPIEVAEVRLHNQSGLVVCDRARQTAGQ